MLSVAYAVLSIIYAESRQKTFILSVIMLNVIMLSVIILSVILMNVVMLSVIILTLMLLIGQHFCLVNASEASWVGS